MGKYKIIDNLRRLDLTILNIMTVMTVMTVIIVITGTKSS